LEQTVRNARLVAETCRVDVPIYAGAGRPLVRPAPTRPAWVHGSDGFGDLGLQPRRRDPDPGFAPDQIVERVMTAPGAITLVTLGPLTNLALAVRREPRLAAAARELIVMGGAVQGHEAEFNMRTDPEAARIVLNAGFRLTIIPIELSRGPTRFTADDVVLLQRIDTPAARLVASLLAYSLSVAPLRPAPAGEHGAACPDGVAMACALDRSLLIERVDAHVMVDTEGEHTAGTISVERSDTPHRPVNAVVGLDLDAPRFKTMVFEAVKSEE
jgi:purine nucleosidase